MSRKLNQQNYGRSFSDDLSTIPDIGTQHGYELASQQTPERAAAMNASPMSHQLTSEERKHYDRALKDMCKIIKASSRRLGDTSLRSDRDDDRSYRRMKQGSHHDRHTLSDELATLSDPDVTLQVGASYNDGTSNGFKGLGKEYDPYDHTDDDYDDEDDVLDEDYMTSPYAFQTMHRKEGNRDADDGLSPGKSSLQFEAVYAELVTISTKLQRQTVALQEREKVIEKREQSLQNLEDTLQTDHSSIRQAYKDFTKRWKKLEEEHSKQVRELEDTIKERTKENKRQKESFDTLKQANDGLRSQLDKVEEQNKKLESQAISLQSRLTNLLRKQELTSRQRDQESMAVKAKVELVKRHGRLDGSAQKSGGLSRSIKQSSGLYDALGILLEWVSEVHLRHYSDDPSKPLESMPSPALTHDRCIRILPALVEVLGQLPSQAARLHLPCLQFIYWSLLHLQSTDKQHVSLSSTYRRLGDELYRPQVVRFASDRDTPSLDPAQSEKPKSAIFFKSANLHIRFLSSLIIMKTVTQVDYLANVFDVLRCDLKYDRAKELHLRYQSTPLILSHLKAMDYLANVFDVLRCDLKDDRAKELYLRYQATPLILSHLKASNRAIVGCAVDIFLQMSMESIFMQQFLYSCCNDVWFRSSAALLSSSGMDLKVVEKLSIILQKLSKIKNNKHLFDSSGTSAIIQDMSRSGACQENAFLALNLRSILFNLNLIKPSSSSMR